MKAPAACNKCGGIAFWRVREMQEHACFQTKPLGDLDCLAPLGERVRRKQRVNGFLFHTDRAVGSFSILICASCGYVEWFANELADLVALAEQGPASATGVRLIDADAPEHGPYR